MTSKKKSQEKKTPDVLRKIKYVGYCRAFTPPGDGMTIDDFIEFAKWTLCMHYKRPWKDILWDSYTSEEILAEYFAYLFTKDTDARSEFERSIDVGKKERDDIYDWLDRKVAENQAEMEKKVAEAEDRVSFSPGDVLGE